MAESWRAKAKRYARGDFTKAELMGAVGVLLVDQAIDIATFGRLSQLKGKAFVRVALPLVKRGGMMAARMAGGAVVTTGGTGLGVGRLLMRNPYLVGGAAIYVGYQERERIKQLLDQGYEFIEERLPTPSPPSPGPLPGVEEVIYGGMAARPVSEFIGAPPRIPKGFDPMTFVRRKRKPSKFNKAVSAGMKVVKRAKRYGGKGKIKPAKSVFAMVTRLASAKKKKKKAPKSGLRRRVWNAMKGLR